MADDYQKVSGSFLNPFPQGAIFLAEDHLLEARSNGVQRQYKRFFYHDIQAVYIQNNRSFRVKTWVSGFFLFLALVILFPGSTEAIGWSIILGVPSLLALVWNLMLGKSCDFTLETKTQSKVLKPLGRYRQAFAAMDLLKERIEAIQGHLQDDVLQQADFAPPARRVAGAESPPAKITQLHFFHYGIWFLTGILLLVTLGKSFSTIHSLAYLALIVFGFLSGLLAIAFNARYHRKATTAEKFTYVSLVLFFLRSGVFYILFIVFTVDNAGISSVDLYRAFLSGEIFNEKLFMVWRNIVLIMALLMGLLGTILCILQRSARK